MRDIIAALLATFMVTGAFAADRPVGSETGEARVGGVDGPERLVGEADETSPGLSGDGIVDGSRANESPSWGWSENYCYDFLRQRGWC